MKTKAPRLHFWPAIWIGAALTISLLFSFAARVRAFDTETQRVLANVLKPPTLHCISDYKIKLLVPPGQMYDPLWPRSYHGRILINDDGGTEDGAGGRILEIHSDGKVTPVVDFPRLMPPTGFGMAPEGFGAYAGEVFTLSQPTLPFEGNFLNHLILHTSLTSDARAQTFCTLPANGKVGHGIAGAGLEAGFGPASGPFANKFFAATGLNQTIYAVTADRVCKPFADFQGIGTPIAFTFTPDRQWMVVSVVNHEIMAPSTGSKGFIYRVDPNGKIAPKPFADGLVLPFGLAYAPKNFGPLGGSLFVTDFNDTQAPVPMGQGLKDDGVVFRIDSDGHPHRFAWGFWNPTGILFAANKMYVSDIGGDYIGGKRELPDGFVASMEVKE